MGRFEQAIQQRAASGRGVAGFFRSHTRKGISLDADDLAFFQARFRDPHHLALLVRPFATKASTAGLFIWENGKVNGDASYLEFPFRSSELRPASSSKRPKPKRGAFRPAPQQPKARRGRRSCRSLRAAKSRFRRSRRAARMRSGSANAHAATAAPVAAAVLQHAAPATIVTPPAPVVEEKAARSVPERRQKPTKRDKNEKIDKTEKNDEEREDSRRIEKTSGARSRRPAKIEKAVTTATPAPKSAPPAKIEKARAAPAFAEPEIDGPGTRQRQGTEADSWRRRPASLSLWPLFVYPGFMRTTSKPPAPAHQDSSQLQLRVERAAGELLLTWNRDSDAIRNASKAVLEITDGDQHENVDMDLAQLANGSIVYSPSGTDISFKMEVLDKSQKTTASESVRMLRTRPSPLQEQTDAAAKAAAAAGATSLLRERRLPPLRPMRNDAGANGTAQAGPAPLKAFQPESLSTETASRRRPATCRMLRRSARAIAPPPSAIPGVS